MPGRYETLCWKCNEPDEDTAEEKLECEGILCVNWIHKRCTEGKEVDSNGHWNCKAHDFSENGEDDISSGELSINLSDTERDKLNDNKESEKNPSEINIDNVTRRKKSQVTPYNDKNDYNPFANFPCENCSLEIPVENPGVLCLDCRSVFHITCLNEQEQYDAKHSTFICQDCILDRLRVDTLKKKQQSESNKSKKHKDLDKTYAKRSDTVVDKSHKNNNKPVAKDWTTTSTPKLKKKNKSISNSRKTVSYNISSSESCDSFGSSSSEESIVSERKKKKKKNVKRRQANSSSSIESSDDSKITKSKAINELFRYTQEERKKAKFEKLPIVEQVDMKWTVFFELFKDSRKLFCHSENIIRIENSIKSKDILSIGGMNLFDPLTYWDTLKMINKRLQTSNNLIAKETQEIIKLRKLKFDCEPKKVIEFINKIVNYSNIIEKHGKKKDKVDDRIISHITNVMPNYLLNGWHKKKAQYDEDDKTVYVKHVAKYLSKQIPYINSKMRAEEIDPWKDNNSHVDKYFKRKDHKEIYTRRNYSTHSNEHESKQTHETSNNQYCWFHKNSSHSASKCFSLLSMSGKEASDLARKNNICTFCGHKHSHRCMSTHKLKCSIEGCSLPHISLFCYKRKSKNDRNYKHNDKGSKYSTNKRTFKQNNSEKGSNSKEQKVKVNKHKEDNNDSSDTSKDNSDISSSKFYINNTNFNAHMNHDRVTSLRNVDLNANCNNNKTDNENRSSICLLGVIVIKFVESDRIASFLLDSGSTVSLIEESLANELEIKGYWAPITLNWSGNIKRTDKKSRVIKTNVCGTGPNAKQHSIFFRTLSNLNISGQILNASEMYAAHPHLRKMHLESYNRIDGIIGMDNAWVFNQLKVFKPLNWQCNVPYGIRCPLGDYVIGHSSQLEEFYSYLSKRLAPKNNNNQHSYNIHLSESETIELAKMESSLMGLEYKQPDNNESVLYEDQLAIDMLKKYVKRSEDGIHFEAPLLWKDENVILPTKESFDVALKRFLIVEKNSLKNGTHTECVEQVNNLLSKGYAEIVPTNEIYNSPNKTFYIPTFFIKPKNKRTRFIWDAATKVEGKSLNDYLLSGPNLYNNYLEMLFNMQEGRYIIKGDIQEMFHQVVMRKEDKDALRFLYRESPNEKIKVLRMKVMIFGSKASPSTSQYVKDESTVGFENELPDAVDVIKRQTYVDDVVTSVNDISYGQQLIYNVRHILGTGGFSLVKLKSNENAILDSIRSNLSKDELANDKIFSKDDHEKLLGYQIDFKNDTVSVALTLEKIPDNILNCEVKPTKKQVLQVCMSIFDPLGFIEFLLSKVKLIFHWLIKDEYEWNQAIDEKYFICWKKCMLWLQEIKNIQIPRWYSCNMSHATVVQLVGFSDASTELLCNVLYIRLLNEHRVQLGFRLVCAKSYIVPLKQNRTIPDLELDSAEKLTRLMRRVSLQHKTEINEFVYLIDNAAVKTWITNGAKNPKVYVKNRLTKIEKITTPNEWKWIPTEYQCADFGTKFSSIPSITYNNDWFIPKLFCLPEENWPQFETNMSLFNYHISDYANELEEDLVLNFKKFSSLNKITRIARLCIKFRYLTQISKLDRDIKNLLVSKQTCSRRMTKNIVAQIDALNEKKSEIALEIHRDDYKYSQIENALFRISQKESFREEYKALENDKTLKKTNHLGRLLAHIDNNGVLRAQSRIPDNDNNRKTFGYDRISPIILSRSHYLTELIIMKYHVAQAHCNEKTVVVNLLQRFHISKIKRTVNNVIKSQCMSCIISRAKPQAPLMGNLPSYRLAVHMPAFSYVIVDLLGPIHVKVTRNTLAKRYVLVYSCLTTRALHLELIESLESHATLRALQNTFNLRGAPLRICSDNGTNFVGANNIMRENFDKWNSELLNRGAIINPIEWDFSPPRAPHMNGSVERMVGLVKKSLKQIQRYMDNRHSHYDDYGLKSILCEVINMINSRPIELIAHEDNQHEYLTPNHFIMGRQNAQSVPLQSIEPKALSQQWEDIKVITNCLWEKWMKSFLPNILLREKWHEHVKPLEVGDLVLTIDPSIANSWRLGIIEKVIVGSQKQVRQVLVRLGRNKVISKENIKSSTRLMNEYKNEIDTIVMRPAVAVAKLRI